MRLVEFVKDRKTREPDADFTLEIIRDAISHGIILIRAGLFSNCIRLLPPIVMTDEQLKEGLSVLEDAIKRAHEKRKTD
jgi:4-aminobutyrate aminotransferase/(S)-3-amino-2-methylpropionate transaminase